MPSQKKFKRRLLIINKSFQYRYILENLKYLMIAIVLILALLWLWSKYRIESGGILMQFPDNEKFAAWAAAQDIKPDKSDYWFYYIQHSKPYTVFDIALIPILICFGITALLITISSIFFSHKIAGPIYRVMKILGSHARGEKQYRFRLRKKDFFRDLADTVNDALKLEPPPPDQE
jgi:hypothetical protein